MELDKKKLVKFAEEYLTTRQITINANGVTQNFKPIGKCPWSLNVGLMAKLVVFGFIEMICSEDNMDKKLSELINPSDNS